MGPLGVDGLKPFVIKRIERTLPGSHAAIGHMELAWFSDANALGLRLFDVEIKDAKDRTIAKAKKLEAALAFDSLLIGHLAPARLTAQDYDIVLSVSNEGKIDLGYDSKGSPKVTEGIEKYWFQLTGRETLGQPISFSRQVMLNNGRVHVYEGFGAFQWTTSIKTLSFSKLKGKVALKLEADIEEDHQKTLIRAQANGLMELKQFSFLGRIENLSPHRLLKGFKAFKRIGFLDAPLTGVMRFDYTRKDGFLSAFLDAEAQKGSLIFDQKQLPVTYAKIVAAYHPQSKTISLQQVNLNTAMLNADITGKITIETPDTSGMIFHYDLSGSRFEGRLADDFPVQVVTNVHLLGQFNPSLKTIVFNEIKANLNSAPVVAHGKIYGDDQGRFGSELTADLNGQFTKANVFAFWPEGLSGPLRSALIERITGGNFYDAHFELNAPPGHFEPFQTQNEDLKLNWSFTHAVVAIDPRMKPVTEMKGRALLEGNRFHLDVDSARLDKVTITKGFIDVPSFTHENARAVISVEGKGDVGSVLQAVNPLTDGALYQNGLNPERVRGYATTHTEVSFPIRKPITNNTLDVKFTSNIQNAEFDKVALGWDMTGGVVTVTGGRLDDFILVEGQASVGPYNGQIAFHSNFEPKKLHIEFKGDFDASTYGGSPYVRMTSAGVIEIEGGQGKGQLKTDIFDGDLSWIKDNNDPQGRPLEMSLTGHILSEGMENQGLPIFKRFEARIPAHLVLARSGDVWSGYIDAQSLSGNIAFIEGVRPRLVYQTMLNQDKARDLGFGNLPMFSTPKPLSVNIALDGASHEALIKLDTIQAVMGWKAVPIQDGADIALDAGPKVDRTLDFRMEADDWQKIGLPKQWFTPIGSSQIHVQWRAEKEGLSGKIYVDQNEFNFEMPSSYSEKDYVLKVSGNVDRPILDKLGYSHDPIKIEGVMAFDLTKTSVDKSEQIHVYVNAQDANLNLENSVWQKLVGSPLEADFIINQSLGVEGIDLNQIQVRGDTIALNGRAVFDEKGALRVMEFNQFRMDRFADISVRYYVASSTQSDVLSVNGRYLDLLPFLKVQPKPDDRPTDTQRPIHWVLQIDQVQTYNQAHLTNLDADIDFDGKSNLLGYVHFNTHQDKKTDITLKGYGAYSQIDATTEDVGGVAEAFFDNQQIKGGSATFAGLYAHDRWEGTLKGRKVRAKNIPVLAQLLTVASLEGLANTLTGDGIMFDSVEIPMRANGNLIFIKDGWAKGQAIGLNFQGTINHETDTLDIDGTLIPAYAVNSIFGDVSANGLGLVGIKYFMDGDIKEPQTMVNPLSIVLPGFIKKWAETKKEDPIAPIDTSGVSSEVNSKK